MACETLIRKLFRFSSIDPSMPTSRFAALTLWALSGCTYNSALFCDENTPCTLSDRPFCDLEGRFPESDGHGRTFIPPGRAMGALSSSRVIRTTRLLATCTALPRTEVGRCELPDRWASQRRFLRGTPIDAGVGTQHSWSPVDQTLIFHSTSVPQDIFSVQGNGLALTNVTNEAGGNDTSARWSPDGSSIAFVSDRSGNDELFIMNADGSNQRQITNNPGRDSSPRWSPDGTELAFTSERAGGLGVYTINTFGAQLRKLADLNGGVSTVVDWSPCL